MDFTPLDLIYVIIRLAIKLLFANRLFSLSLSLAPLCMLMLTAFVSNNSLSCFLPLNCTRIVLNWSIHWPLFNRQCIVLESFQRETERKETRRRTFTVSDGRSISQWGWLIIFFPPKIISLSCKVGFLTRFIELPHEKSQSCQLKSQKVIDNCIFGR